MKTREKSKMNPSETSSKPPSLRVNRTVSAAPTRASSLQLRTKIKAGGWGPPNHNRTVLS
jgi:hypothetical protein